MARVKRPAIRTDLPPNTRRSSRRQVQSEGSSTNQGNEGPVGVQSPTPVEATNVNPAATRNPPSPNTQTPNTPPHTSVAPSEEQTEPSNAALETPLTTPEAVMQEKGESSKKEAIGDLNFMPESETQVSFVINLVEGLLTSDSEDEKDRKEKDDKFFSAEETPVSPKEEQPSYRPWEFGWDKSKKSVALLLVEPHENEDMVRINYHLRAMDIDLNKEPEVGGDQNRDSVMEDVDHTVDPPLSPTNQSPHVSPKKRKSVGEKTPAKTKKPSEEPQRKRSRGSKPLQTGPHQKDLPGGLVLLPQHPHSIQKQKPLGLNSLIGLLCPMMDLVLVG